jgi:hypothetical protein
MLQVSKHKNHFIAVFLILFLALNAVSQDPSLFIYGKVTAKNNVTSQGIIHWGNEEALWMDMFNSTKNSNDYLPFLKDDQKKVAESESTSKVVSIQIDYAYGTIHTFECQFGDISSVHRISDTRINLQLKDGFLFHLKDGSNDIGATLHILDNAGKVCVVNWDDIETVEFMPVPKDHLAVFGNPLQGTVITNQGSFSGFIEWDQDERISTDLLDGDDSQGNDLSIPFSEIQALVKLEAGTLVILTNGEELTISGSNDVNEQNRGIMVNTDGRERIIIPWEEFIKVTFGGGTGYKGTAYQDYSKPEYLRGTVFRKDGQSSSGLLIYDMDEIYDIEYLQGSSGGIEYQIPFRNIAAIKPIDEHSSEIHFKFGAHCVLSDMEDVSSSMNGIMVIEDAGIFSIISRDEIDEIIFK